MRIGCWPWSHDWEKWERGLYELVYRSGGVEVGRGEVYRQTRVCKLCGLQQMRPM